MQNGFIERFNRSYREAVLDMFVFHSLLEVCEQTELWLKEYNEEHANEVVQQHSNSCDLLYIAGTHGCTSGKD